MSNAEDDPTVKRVLGEMTADPSVERICHHVSSNFDSVLPITSIPGRTWGTFLTYDVLRVIGSWEKIKAEIGWPEGGGR